MKVVSGLVSAAAGLASGYCYRKYTRWSALSFVIPNAITTTRIQRYLDFNGDNRVDLQDLKIVEQKSGLHFGIVSGIIFTSSFGIGYVIGYFFKVYFNYVMRVRRTHDFFDILFLKYTLSNTAYSIW